MRKEIHRKIFLDELPKQKGYGGKRVKWADCVGLSIRVLYDDIDTFVEIINHTPETNLLTIRNKIYGDYEILSGNLVKCKLGKYFNKHTNEFKAEIGQEIKDDRRDLIITDRKIIKDKKGRNYKCYKYKCNKCGYDCGEHYKSGEFREELWIEENNLLSLENGCSCCCNPNQIVVEGINDIPTTAPWMVKYFQGGYDEAKRYVKNSMSKINPICPYCGKAKGKLMNIRTIHIEKSIGCKFCGDGVSYPSKFVKGLLEQIGINYEQEVKFDWCCYYNEYSNKNSYGLYDFVIESMDIIIEVDGEFHRKDNRMNGITKEEIRYIDNEKDRLANKNGYTVIRISDEDIKASILNSELSKLFDLSKVDWSKCEEFALKNLVKEVCDYWNNKNECDTTKDLACKFNISRTGIINYLKKGVKLGWCNYEPKEEMMKCGKVNGEKLKKKLSKKVEIFKNEISLGVFESVVELSKQSEEKFGVKLDHRSISAICRNEFKNHKGYTFKYVS